jgi:HNH endonuclease/transposase IS204/IS1001/IS1096/IS1165 family protein
MKTSITWSPGAGLNVVGVERRERAWTVTVDSRQPTFCPGCGAQSKSRHSTYWRTFWDLSAQGAPVIVNARLGRWRYLNQLCDRRIFTERVPSLAAPFARLAGIVRLLGHSAGGRPSERLMRRLGMPVSDTTILAGLRNHARARSESSAVAAVHVAGIDDWADFRRRSDGGLRFHGRQSGRRRQPLAPRGLREPSPNHLLSRDRAWTLSGHSSSLHRGWDRSSKRAHITFGLPGQNSLTPPATEIERRYALQTVKQRLHQASFREAVIGAYRGRCALSGFPESMLLDAAHIVEDQHELLGQPVVRNGIPLSKIHHAAFDAHLIGIDPDFRLHVSKRLLLQHDGPMLEGIKRVEPRSLAPPKKDAGLPRSRPSGVAVRSL